MPRKDRDNPEYRAKDAERKRKEYWSDHDRQKLMAGKRRRFNRYGLNEESYMALFASQESSCAVCKKELEPLAITTHIDHCHACGSVRGILCSKCNVGIGMMQDDVHILSTAIEYLTKHQNGDTLRVPTRQVLHA